MKSGDSTSRPEDPINPGGKAIVTISGTFRQGKGLRNDQWPSVQLQRDAGEGVVTENPQVVVGDKTRLEKVEPFKAKTKSSSR